MINPAANDRAVGELRPISRPNDARIARPYVKHAIGIVEQPPKRPDSSYI
jgi:hypothetical protein